MKKNQVWLVFVAIMIALLCYVVWSTSTFQDCIGEQYAQANPNHDDTSEVEFTFVDQMRAEVGCAAHLFFESRDAFTAIATIFIALFTWTLWMSTDKLWQLGRSEFNATHRPKLRIRNIVVRPPTEMHAAKFEFFAGGYPVSGQLYADNFGDGNATILHSHCMVSWGHQPLPMEAPYEGSNGNEFLGHPSLKPGASIPGVFQSIGVMPNEQVAVNILCGNEGWRLWVMGWVEYADAERFVRRMRFCRIWSANDRRFIDVDNRDYDYED